MNWNTGEIIRRIRDGHAYLVVQKMEVCTMVIDLFESDRVNKLMAILVRDYKDFEREQNMKVIEHRQPGESTLSWKKDNLVDRLQGEQAWIS